MAFRSWGGALGAGPCGDGAEIRGDRWKLGPRGFPGGQLSPRGLIGLEVAPAWRPAARAACGDAVAQTVVR